jgi:hypothetical protein
MPDITAGRSAQFKVDNAANWDTARDASTATASKPTNGAFVKLATASGGYDIYRGAMAFNTSGISEAPASVTLKLYGFGSQKVNNIRIVKGNQAATGDYNSDYVDGDFDQLVFGTPYSDEFNVSSWTTSGFNEITLNAAARSDMASLSSFEIFIVAEHDFDDSDPNTATKSGPGWRGVAYANSSRRPKISYTAASVSSETHRQKLKRLRRKRTRGSKGKGFATTKIESPTSGGKVVGNGFKTNGF